MGDARTAGFSAGLSSSSWWSGSTCGDGCPSISTGVDFRRSLYRADPLIPIMGILSALGAVVFALNSGGRAAVLAWIGFALIALIMVASMTLADPMN